MAGQDGFHSSSFPSSSISKDWDSSWHTSRFPTHRQDRDHHHAYNPYDDFDNLQSGVRFPRKRSAHHSHPQDDTSAYLVFFVAILLLFVSLIIVSEFYGPEELVLGPNSSVLLQPNPIFVQSLKVENLNESNSWPILYEFHEIPPLDTIITWTEKYNLSVARDYHKERTYFLNVGSQMNVSYQLSSRGSSLLLVLAKGSKEFNDWLNEPRRQSTALSWNRIHGSGMVTQDIFHSSRYYVAIGNLNEEVKVELQLRIAAHVYNTTRAYRECSLYHGSCSTKIAFPYGNSAVIVSPGHQGDKSIEEWCIKLSYEPRWGTFIGIGVMSLLVYLASIFLRSFQHHRGSRSQVRKAVDSERGPLLPLKVDEFSSRCSSYDPLSHDCVELGRISVQDIETLRNC